ncbi:MAG: dihydroorotate dehydrogenase 2 [Pseudomonadota bacterium]
MYKTLLKPLFFSMDPEHAHDLMRTGAQLANVSLISGLLKGFFNVVDPRLSVTVAGLSFPNPIGLAAGLDKNVELVGLCAGLGFGHLELGTVTGRPQPGNPKPRIFRIADEQALINRMGFPSEGADVAEGRLRAVRARFPSLPPIGINIGKSKVVELDQAIEDYCYSFERLAPLADYVTVNVSSPNTQGLRQLQERDRLTALLRSLAAANTHHRPIFVKVAPDLELSALDEVVDVCAECSVAGIIATNTTISRDSLRSRIEEAGGLSGAPLREKSLKIVEYLGQRVSGRMALIGVGGVSSAGDVLSMIGAGASMVQVYTALIYEGPALIRTINQELISYMNAHGYRNLQEAGRAWFERRQVA